MRDATTVTDRLFESYKGEAFDGFIVIYKGTSPVVDVKGNAALFQNRDDAERYASTLPDPTSYYVARAHSDGRKPPQEDIAGRI